MIEFKKPAGRPRIERQRARKTYFLDCDVVDAIAAMSRGNETELVNRLLRQALNLGEPT